MTFLCNYNRKTNPIHKDGIYHIKASFFYFCALHVITKKSNCCPHRDVFDITKVLFFLQITTIVTEVCSVLGMSLILQRYYFFCKSQPNR